MSEALSDSQPVQLKPIEKPSITDLIVERLTTFILDSGLKAGAKLPSERELMLRLSVGRSTLREAIKILRAIGIVEVSGGEGMFVGQGDTSVFTQPFCWSVLMSGASAHEVMESRRIIEIQLAGLAAQRGTEESVRQIGIELGKVKAQASADKIPGFLMDLDFHLAVARAAENALLAHVLNTLHRVLQAIVAEIHLKHHVGVRPGDELAEIVPIYEAIRKGDQQAARSAMENHLKAAEARLPAVPRS